jgi:hypothetical protein
MVQVKSITVFVRSPAIYGFANSCNPCAISVDMVRNEFIKLHNWGMKRQKNDRFFTETEPRTANQLVVPG